MNEVSTTAALDTQDAQEAAHELPPIACAPWCEDGTGHTAAEHPSDQYCSAGYLAVDLDRQPLEQIRDGGAFHRPEMTVVLERDPFSEPDVSWSVTGSPAVKLTLAEARQLGAHLVHLANVADQA